jgi:hypothetical protein
MRWIKIDRTLRASQFSDGTIVMPDETGGDETATA